ncbi:MAG: hypothetical protein AAF594_16100, partial [Bacteroidota bacterium]
MNAAQFSPDTWEFLQLLARHRVAYVIVGDEAVIHYGHIRLTGDLDVFYGTNPDNAGRLRARRDHGPQTADRCLSARIRR